MKIHNLKIAPEFYEAVIAGDKTFEIRKNDRNFQVGDRIIMAEYMNGEYTTSPSVSAHIGYITDYAQRDGFVVFSFYDMQVIEGDSNE